MNIFNFYYYLLLFLILTLAFYFIKQKVDFIYDINKQVSFIGKMTLLSLFSLYLLYLYSIYSRLLNQILDIYLSPFFKTIHCESTSSEAAREMESTLQNNERKNYYN